MTWIYSSFWRNEGDSKQLYGLMKCSFSDGFDLDIYSCFSVHFVAFAIFILGHFCAALHMPLGFQFLEFDWGGVISLIESGWGGQVLWTLRSVFEFMPLEKKLNERGKEMDV